MNLYCVDLATVISKYVGETEKNLRQVFIMDEAITPSCCSMSATLCSVSGDRMGSELAGRFVSTPSRLARLRPG